MESRLPGPLSKFASDLAALIAEVRAAAYMTENAPDRWGRIADALARIEDFQAAMKLLFENYDKEQSGDCVFCGEPVLGPPVYRSHLACSSTANAKTKKQIATETRAEHVERLQRLSDDVTDQALLAGARVAVAQSPKIVADYKAGKKTSAQGLIGIMKKTFPRARDIRGDRLTKAAVQAIEEAIATSTS